MYITIKRKMPNPPKCESEASETLYWLEVILEVDWLSKSQVQPEYDECDELLAIFTSINSKIH